MPFCISCQKRKRILLLFLCTFLCLCLFFSLSFLGRLQGQVFLIKGFPLPASTLSGIISAFDMLLCIIMVFINYKIGSKIAIGIIMLTIFGSIAQIFRVHTLHSLPGAITPIISLFSISIITFFYKRSTLNSYTDSLTNLQNRRKFIIDLNEKISSKREFCLAYIEIEEFKSLVDLYGLQIADFVLKTVGEEINRLISKKISLYKITGATFALIFDFDSEYSENVKDTVSEILKSVKSEQIFLPTEITGGGDDDILHSAKVNLAAGLALFPFDGDNETSLLKKTDVALSAAKKSHNQKICFYTADLEESELRQREAENLIRESLEKNYFYLVYQPQFNISDKKLRGFETLIRCRLPDGSVVSPVRFIPAAEKSSLIFKIDDYVLRRAMREFKPILAERGANYIISINVSAKNIALEDFADRVKKILAEIDFPPSCLEIEITEYSLADSMENTIENIRKLREIGVHIALDDFGTGYTSIAELMRLPINLLKIDKSLIDNIESNNSIRDLVNSVIYMGHVMNCKVISEGVENEKQIDVLKAHKCDFVQGFVWGKPLSLNDASNLC